MQFETHPHTVTRILSGQLIGVHGIIVEVESRPGTPISRETRHAIAGTEQSPTLREARIRAETALDNTFGANVGNRHVKLDVGPSDLRLSGTAFDLPIAVAFMGARGWNTDKASGYLFAGELSLEGTLRSIRGALSLAVCAREHGLRGIILPAANANEAAVVAGIEVLGVRHLRDVADWLNGVRIAPTQGLTALPGPATDDIDFSEVRGQEPAKRALEIAAAGGHNAMLIGPPGSGKTMLARRLPTILPPLNFAEAVETTKIYSVAGLLPENEALVTRRPFRSPHHTISDAGLIGGGPSPRPGEVSLAHNGVLFLDELPEFKKHVLETLREPMEDKRVTIARAAVSLSFPANFMLVTAMNRCPCGYSGDALRACSCSAAQIRNYKARVSPVLLDALDLHIEVPAVRYRELARATPGETSAQIRSRVDLARDIQRRRFERTVRVHVNAQMGPRLIALHCALDKESAALLASVTDRLGLSARAHDRVLKVARTIADLAGSEKIQSMHIAEAIQYRTLDRAEA